MAFLASDELQGRETGNHSLRVAARYLATELAKMKLAPVGDNGTYFQEYTLLKQQVSPESYMAVESQDGQRKEFAFGEAFVTLSRGRSVSEMMLHSEVAFVGYGISAPAKGYDEYAGIDVKDKLLLVMGAEPRREDGTSLLDSTASTAYGQMMTKMQNAMASGAKGMILISPSSEVADGTGSRQFARFARFLRRPRYTLPNGTQSRNGAVGFAIVLAREDVAEAILQRAGKTLHQVQSEIAATQKPASFALDGTIVEIRIDVTTEEVRVPNVVGLLEGSDPVLKDEVVVFSAHYDHVGIDKEGNIFNGADDNGSGTSALLEIAQAFAENPIRPKRSVLFLWVSGEEKGLLGSRYYTEHPIIPIENTVANINMDMIGRVRAPQDTSKANEMLALAGTVYVVGGHQSSELKKINEEAAKKAGLTIDYSLNDLNHPQRIYYRSDHFNFARKGIPVLFYTSGLHVDYHKPTDTIEKINFAKIKSVATLAYLTGWQVANQKNRVVVDNRLNLN